MQIRSIRSIYSGIVLMFLLLTVGINSENYVNVDFISFFDGDVFGVDVDGDYAYIGQGQDHVVLDLTDLSKPSEVMGTITPPEVLDFAVESDCVYVSGDGLLIVDITALTYLIFYISME